MCGLVLLLSFSFKRISKVKQVDCCMNLSLKVFQTDPGEFCFASNVLGLDQVYYQVRYRLELQKRSWSRDVFHIFTGTSLFPLCVVLIWMYTLMLWYQFFDKVLLIIIFCPFRCETLIFLFFYSNISFILFSPSIFFLIAFWVFQYLSLDTGCVSVWIRVSKFPGRYSWYQSNGLGITLALWYNSIEIGLVIP